MCALGMDDSLILDLFMEEMPMPCYSNDTISICRSNYRRKIVGNVVKWCFGCRKRLVHSKVFHIEKLVWKKDQLVSGGYAEPYMTVECPGCKEDRTDFPGDNA